MRGIPEEAVIKYLRDLAKSQESAYEFHILNTLLKNECKELQQPWMTLDEFLKSGFEGWCWVKHPYHIHISYFSDRSFKFNDVETRPIFTLKYVTHVMLINKPEPPKL